MNAGREMDVLVAEKTMGKTDAAQRHRAWCLNLKSDNPSYCEGPIHTPDGITHNRCAVPAYSTDIAAAWEVVEKLRSLGLSITLHDNFRGGEWQACVEKRTDLEIYPRPFRAFNADTAPLAICRAALNAVGVEA